MTELQNFDMEAAFLHAPLEGEIWDTVHKTIG